MARKITGLSGVPLTAPCGDVTHSISSRRIDNGYVISESTYGDGEYKSCERFSKTAPRAPKMGGREGSVGDEGLSGAIRECKS